MKAPVDKEKRIEIIQDILFEKGLALTPLDPRIVRQGGGFAKTYVDTLDFNRNNSNPVWQLAQWYSKYTLADSKHETKPDGSISHVNQGGTKKVALYPDHSLLLQVNAGEEYDSPRIDGQHWPHLLIAQKFKEMAPIVGQVERLEFSIKLMLVKSENKMAEGTFKPSLHTAHTPFFFVLRNDNNKSPDYNQKIWFGIPSYDYRKSALSDEEKVMWDIGTNTYIYNVPPRSVWGDVNLHDKQWHSGQADLKPLILKALNAMREKGVFLNTSLSDLKVTGMNFGWEVPGTFDVAIRVKGISLVAVYESK